MQAVFTPGAYISRSYTILSATGGRIGTFGSLTTSGLPAGFTAGLSYTATDTILNLFANLAVLPNDIGTGVPIIYRLDADSTVKSKLDLAA